MHLVDVAGAMAAMRHARKPVVTASVDSLHFLHPVHIGELIILSSSVNRVFRTSMEVGVKVVTENLMTGERLHTCSAHLTFVALDENGNAAAVAPVIPETEEEKRRFREAGERREYRLARKRRQSAFVRRSPLLVHVLDARLVEQQVGLARAIHLQAAPVVPFDGSVQRFSIAQHKDHGGLGLHLLHVVKILRIGLIRRNRLFLRRGPAGRRDLFFDLVKRRTNKFAIDSFHGMPSFEKIMIDPRYWLQPGGFSRIDSLTHT